MNDTYVTLQGWVGNDVDVRDVNGTLCASFRVGATPRYLRNGEWTNGETQWYTVNCWRSLGRNVSTSVRKGDAVVVHGRVRVDVWERDGHRTVSWIVDATFVGHDLNRGATTFQKTGRSTAAEQAGHEGPREVHPYDATGPQPDTEGRESPAA